MATAIKHPTTRDPAMHSGAPVFTGTRIAVKILFDYLAPSRDDLGPDAGGPLAADLDRRRDHECLATRALPTAARPS